MTPDGVGEVHRLHAGRRPGRPPTGTGWSGMLRVVRGTMRFVVDIKPRFDYGRRPHKLDVTDDGVGLPRRAACS